MFFIIIILVIFLIKYVYHRLKVLLNGLWVKIKIVFCFRYICMYEYIQIFIVGVELVSYKYITYLVQKEHELPFPWVVKCVISKNLRLNKGKFKNWLQDYSVIKKKMRFSTIFPWKICMPDEMRKWLKYRLRKGITTYTQE